MNDMHPAKSASLCMSVFYARQDWHLLLAQLKAELYPLDKKQPGINRCLVFLSQERGTSIRIMFDCSSAEKAAVTDYLHSCVKKFLQSHASLQTPVTLPLQSFFCDYPNNEIRYNLYDDKKKIHGYECLQEQISALLLLFFEDHPVNDEAIFTFLLYLQHATILALAGRSALQVVLNEIRIKIKSDGRLSAYYQVAKSSLEVEALEPGMFEEAPAEILQLLRQLKATVIKLGAAENGIANTYFRMMDIARKHLFDLSSEIVVDTFFVIESMLATNHMQPGDNDHYLPSTPLNKIQKQIT